MFIDKFFSRTFPDVFAELMERIFGSTSNLYRQTKERVLQPIELQIQATDLKPVVVAMPVMLTADNPETWFVKLVEDCLRKYSDSIALGQSPLADHVGLKCDSQIARGRQLQQLLHDAIQSLRPAGMRPSGTLPRAWFNYVILHDAYVIGIRNREVMVRLYISEGTFNRTRRNALRGVAMCLLEGMKQGSMNN